MQKRQFCRSRSSRSVPVESPHVTSVAELSQLIVQILDTLCFEPPFGGGLGTMYDVHLGLIGKRVVDFLLVIIELFSLDVTAEALRAKIDRKSAISFQRGQFDRQFQVEGDVLHQ